MTRYARLIALTLLLPITVSAGDRQQVYEAISSTFAGFEHHHYIGILANVKAESAYNPRAVGDNGKSKGLFQYQPPRQRDFYHTTGIKVEDADVWDQVSYAYLDIMGGIESGVYNKLLNADTACKAAMVWSEYYERPLRVQTEKRNRCRIANQLISEIQR